MLSTNENLTSINGIPEPVRGSLGAPILGPRNIPLEHENPDLLVSPQTDAGTIPNLKFSFATARNRVLTGGLAREVTVRELHWHPTSDEWQYYISGRGRMTVFASSGKARTFYHAGDVGCIPSAMGHYIENTGDETLRFLEVFRSDRFADLLLSQWMGLTPPGLVQAHLNLDQQTMAALPENKPVIVASKRDSFWKGPMFSTQDSEAVDGRQKSPKPLPEWPTGTVAILKHHGLGPLRHPGYRSFASRGSPDPLQLKALPRIAGPPARASGSGTHNSGERGYGVHRTRSCARCSGRNAGHAGIRRSSNGR